MTLTTDHRPLATPVYRRILLKLSGEALMGAQNYGIDVQVAESVAQELRTVHEMGVEIAIVVGGGNIFRGVSESAGNMNRAAADYIGMLATIMNAVVLQDALEKVRHTDPSDVGHRYSAAGRAVHPPAGSQASRKTASSDLCRGYGQSLFHNGFSGGPAGTRDRG